MLHLQSNLHTANLTGMRVFVRADVNGSLSSKPLFKNDFRLQHTLPTLQLIQQKGGVIIFCSHDGRPTHHEKNLSMEQFLPWFKSAGFNPVFAATVKDAHRLSIEKKYDLIILENIRFFPGEEACDKEFAQELSTCADYYVNDAFGSCHRESATLTIMPTLFLPEQRSIGLLVEAELAHINAFIENKKDPFTVMIGGTKGETKIPLLHALLPKIDTLLITAPLCFTFFQALGRNIGKSYSEPSQTAAAENLLKEAEKKNVSVIFPTDFQVTENSFEEPKKIRIVSSLAENDVALSVGPHTTDIFKKKLVQAKTIFINGIPGNEKYIETLESTRIILHALQRSTATCLIGGGDSVPLVHALGFDALGFLSTGGGATLAYMSNQVLPALEIFMR